MKSKLAIDGVLQGFFSYELSTYRENEELNRAIRSYDFQDTDCNNETECYFYFPNTMPMEKIREFGLRIHNILGVDPDYNWRIEDQTKDGNPEIRLEIICSLEI